MTGVDGYVSFSQDNVPFTTIGMLGSTHTTLITASLSSSQIDETVTTTVKTTSETSSAADSTDSRPSRTIPTITSSSDVQNPTASSSATNIPPSTSPTATASPSRHPSTSVTIGIVFGVAIPIAGLISFLIWRRRGRKAPATAQTSVLPKSPFEVKYHRPDISRMGYPPAELYGRAKSSWRAELADLSSSPRAPHELPATVDFVSELAQPPLQSNKAR